MLFCVVFSDVIVMFKGAALQAWMYLFSSSNIVLNYFQVYNEHVKINTIFLNNKNFKVIMKQSVFIFHL